MDNPITLCRSTIDSIAQENQPLLTALPSCIPFDPIASPSNPPSLSSVYSSSEKDCGVRLVSTSTLVPYDPAPPEALQITSSILQNTSSLLSLASVLSATSARLDSSVLGNDHDSEALFDRAERFAQTAGEMMGKATEAGRMAMRDLNQRQEDLREAEEACRKREGELQLREGRVMEIEQNLKNTQGNFEQEERRARSAFSDATTSSVLSNAQKFSQAAPIIAKPRRLSSTSSSEGPGGAMKWLRSKRSARRLAESDAGDGRDPVRENGSKFWSRKRE